MPHGHPLGRPYTFNYKTNLLVPIGSYAQWQPYITNGYAGPGTCGVPHAKKSLESLETPS